MPFSRDVNVKYIIEKLAQIQSMVYLSNQQQLYDIDHVLEDFCTGLLNIVFNLKLHNINAETKNSSAIDLGDTENRIAIQITSDRSGTKIKETVDKFISHGWYKTYTELKVVLLVPRQSRYTVIIDTKGLFDFSTESDILDFSQIIASIKDKDVDHIVAVRNYIEKEFPGECPAINWKSYDRVKSIIKQIESGQEREVALDIEFLFGEEILTKYNTLMTLVKEQTERKEFMDYYDQQLRAILTEESRENEYEILVAQAEQNNYFEPLYDFCAEYNFFTEIPYDRTRREVINFRKEHQNIIRREHMIADARRQCVEAIKIDATRLIAR